MLYQSFVLLLYNLLMMVCEGKPVSVVEKMYSHMSGCEYSVHTKCVLVQGNKEKLTNKCDEKGLLKCLNNHLALDICAKDDTNTLATIRALITEVERRFQRNKKCANENFLNNIRDHFHVQGEGIEYSKISTDYTYSGSGTTQDDNDDTEDDLTDDDNVIEDEIEKQTNTTTQSKKDVKFWFENAKKISKRRQTVQLLVFFDDPEQYRKNKLQKQKQISKKVISAWEKLKRNYRDWYRSSKYFSRS